MSKVHPPSSISPASIYDTTTMAPSTWWDPSQIRETVDQSGPRKTGGPEMIDLREDSPVGSSINHAIDISCGDGVKSEETNSPTRMPSVQSTAEGHLGSDENVDSKPTVNKSTTVRYPTGGHLSGDDNVDFKSTSGDKRTSTKRKVDAVVSARSEACKKKSLYADASVTLII
ncbi:hypothetical protein CkaCkLH20_00549 [Colletotrichum karsti]|uniref:Uncharacterized protein n=1 Tax=Colletotrichum karsti TaxID=1095194 RepID=A0A9P6IGN8_9PEZI|nr:uncharacterized protein CkaCkLH20_00549 [Colletotrichum karsti]KAF9882513.1 hypothetical protein CkaCkLH20_00549 [Colletotrichum karsti]